jgi:hypothetical protein
MYAAAAAAGAETSVGCLLKWTIVELEADTLYVDFLFLPFLASCV